MRRTSSLISSAIFAPMAAPAIAVITQGTARRALMKPCLAKRYVAKLVPMLEASLLVPRAVWTGMPVMKKAGREISPPPPAMASIAPARKANGHTIKNGTMMSKGMLSSMGFFLFLVAVIKPSACRYDNTKGLIVLHYGDGKRKH